MQHLNHVLFQIDIAVVEEHKAFEGVAMIPEGTQGYGNKPVPEGPALQDASGEEYIKSAKEGKGGFFPPEVAESGALVRVQDAEASWPSDKTVILNHIVGSADPSSEPPAEHATYDKMNRTVQGLFRGAALFSHALHGRPQKLRDLLSQCTEGIDYQIPSGGTPAYISALKGHTDCLQVLAANKADLNQPRNNGETSAWISAQNGHTECIQLLADNKADLNQPTKDGITPACISAENGHTDCLQVLADNTADLNTPDNDGGTVPSPVPSPRCLYVAPSDAEGKYGI